MTSLKARGPVGQKLIRALRRQRSQTVIDFTALAEGARRAKAFQEERTAQLESVDVEPAHGWYVLAQHQLAGLVEQIGERKETRDLTEPICDAEDEYMPSGPPMSPLTASYFFYWSICDLSPRGDGETLATATLDLVREIGIDPQLLAAMETLSASRMGLWEHRGQVEERVILRELVTGIEHRCLVPSGYRGQPGELWLARVLPPPPIPGADAVVITTPYLLIRTSPDLWRACLDRVLAPYPAPQRPQIYPLLMKFGEKPRYWPEFIFEAYINHQPDVIFLTGYPDIPESRPHARVSP